MPIDDSQTPNMPSKSKLLIDDPVKVGEFWLDYRMLATPAGIAYLAHNDVATEAIVIVLSEGASKDAAARDRFAGEINAMHIDSVFARGGQGQDIGRLANKFKPQNDYSDSTDNSAIAPWVAIAYSKSPAAWAEAKRILTAVDLTQTAQLGNPAGPDYELPWAQKTRPGNWRLWPLPWPGRKDHAGWLSILSSFLLMLLLAALAILIAILLFQDKPSGSSGSSDDQTNRSSSTSTTTTTSSSESANDQTNRSSSTSTTTTTSAFDHASDTPSMINPSGKSTAQASNDSSQNPKLFFDPQ